MVVRIFRRPLITPSSTSATVLNAAIPTLKVVRTAANASHASILGSVASVLLTCVETVKDARTNKEDAVELIVRIIALVLPTIKWMQEMHFPTTPVAQSLLHDLQALIPTFEQVSSAMTKITRRNFFAQVVLSLADKDIIQQQRRMLDSALHNFTVTSLMRIQVVSSIETEIDYTICKAPDVELVEEVHDLELDPQSKCATCSTFSCNERFQRLYRGRLRVDGSSVKVFQYKQDTNALHFLADVRRHQDLLHPHIAQFRGASQVTNNREKIIVVDDHPFGVYETLWHNFHGLSVEECVRLSFKTVADIGSALQYVYETCGHPMSHKISSLKFDARLSKAVYHLSVDESFQKCDWPPPWQLRDDLVAFINMFTPTSQPQKPHHHQLYYTLSPIFNDMQHSMWGRSYKDLASAFSALLCEWEATTRRTSDRPNLRKLLGPHFTFNMGMPHLTHMLEPGDIAYIDYPPPTLTSTTRFGDATQVTFIRNVADDIRISCGITDETLKMAHEDTQTLSLGRPRVCCRSLYSKSLLARSHSSIAWHGARDRKINAYLANIQNEMAREYGVTSGHRLLFMVVSVTQLVNSTLEWSSIPSDGRAILESQAGRLQRVHEDNPGFYFHPNITTPWEADAVNPWGYWSTSPQWAPLGEREEYIIPSVSSEQAFWNTPEVEVECYRVKAVIDATEPYGYTIAVIDEY